jgi:thioredoxin-related protein
LKRSAIVLLTLLLFAFEANAAWTKSLAAAKEKAKKSDSLIFVDLFAQWCGWCHRMEAEVFPSESFQNATKKMVLLRLDTEDGKEGSEFARDFGIRSLPTFLLLTADGMLAGTITGYAPAKPFAERVGQVEAEYRAFEKRLNGEKNLKDPLARLALAKELGERRAFDASDKRLQALIDDRTTPPAVRDQTVYQLGLGKMMRNKYDEALKVLKPFVGSRKLGEYVERANLLIADIYMRQGNFKAALEQFKAFKKQFPNSPLNKNFEALLPQLESRVARAQ